MRALIVEGIADGSIKPCHPGLVSSMLFGSLNWVPRWYQEGGKLSIEQVVDSFMDVVLTSGIAGAAALRPAPEAASPASLQQAGRAGLDRGGPCAQATGLAALQAAGAHIERAITSLSVSLEPP